MRSTCGGQCPAGLKIHAMIFTRSEARDTSGGGSMNDYICFLDTEKEYMLRLSAQLNIKNNTGRRIICFTDRSSFLSGTGKMAGGILVVAEKDWDGEIANTDIALNSCCMILDEGTANPKCGELPHICKYNSAGGILKDILSSFLQDPENTSGLHLPGKKTRVIGTALTGLEGRDELFAFSLAGNLGRMGPSLLIDLGTFPAFESTSGNDTGLSDILFYMHGGSGDLPDMINSASRTFGNLSYIPTVSHPRDLRDISDEDIRKLIDGISGRCIYEYVILAFPLFLSDLESLTGIPGTVFVPETPSPLVKNRIRSFSEFIAQQGDGNAGKIRRILLPEIFDLPPGSSAAEEAAFGKVGSFTASVIKKEFDDL